MLAENQTFIAATGPALAAGQPLTLTLSGLPHQSSAPRYIALALAIGIILVGVVMGGSSTTDATARAADRKKLVARREKSLADLARLEQDRRRGKVDDARYASRREELVASLEQVYGALDDADAPDVLAAAGHPAPSSQHPQKNLVSADSANSA
jgi:hypothetical protein